VTLRDRESSGFDRLRLDRGGRRAGAGRLQPQQRETRAAHREGQYYTQPKGSKGRANQRQCAYQILHACPKTQWFLKVNRFPEHSDCVRLMASQIRFYSQDAAAKPTLTQLSIAE